MRAVFASIVALALLATAVPADASQKDLQRAQRRANRAAQELAEAQSQHARLEQEVDTLEGRVKATVAELGTLQAVVKAQAVEQYIRGASDLAVGFDDADLAAATRASALARFVRLDQDESLDEYRRLSEDLGVMRSELDEARASSSDLLEELEERADAAFAELRKLEKLEAERRAREARLRRSPPRTARSSSRVSFIAGDGGWMCPVQGPRAFTNDWGQPRSGGRRHQGTDILAPRGTPVVAVVGGSVRGHNSSLGGISFYLSGDDGHVYFGTHLDSLAGVSGHVRQGTVIGYVGNTGNARGGPTHLHFEIHPGGGRPVNPYPTLAQHC